VLEKHFPIRTKQNGQEHISPRMRYNVMTSNSAESINVMSRYAQCLPIAMLIDVFRISLQQWYYDRREIGAKYISIYIISFT